MDNPSASGVTIFMHIHRTEPEVLMKTRLEKATTKAGRVAKKATRAASSLATSTSKSVTAAVKKVQRKRKIAQMKRTAKKVGAGLAAAAAITGAALVVREARKPKSRFS